MTIVVGYQLLRVVQSKSLEEIAMFFFLSPTRNIGSEFALNRTNLVLLTLVLEWSIIKFKVIACDHWPMPFYDISIDTQVMST